MSDVETMLIQRLEVESTLNRHCFNVVCLLGGCSGYLSLHCCSKRKRIYFPFYSRPLSEETWCLGKQTENHEVSKNRSENVPSGLSPLNACADCKGQDQFVDLCSLIGIFSLIRV